MWQHNYEPIGGSLGLSAVIAAIPIVVLFVMLGLLRKPAWVSALAALIISHNPNLSPESVRRIIETTATPLADGSTPNWDGRGRIRMTAALLVPRFFLGVAGIASE